MLESGISGRCSGSIIDHDEATRIAEGDIRCERDNEIVRWKKLSRAYLHLQADRDAIKKHNEILLAQQVETFETVEKLLEKIKWLENALEIYRADKELQK